ELAAVKPAAWSTSSSLSLAVSGTRRGPQQPLDEEWLDDDTHWQRCAESGAQANCTRCRFEAGFAGMLRRGARGFQPESDGAAWKNLFQFQHPRAGWKTWLVTKPRAWGGKWSMGCWICSHYEPPKFGSSFGRLGVSMINTVAPSSFKKHEGSQSHLEAVAAMKAQLASDSSEGLYTQATDTVPRLEKFYLAGLVVSRHDTFTDFEQYVRGLALTCPLPTGSDISRKTCCQMVCALARPLYEQDQAVIEHASTGSIAFDVRDGLMLVVGRFAYSSLRPEVEQHAFQQYLEMLNETLGNMKITTRDRAHRVRSCMKGVFDSLNQNYCDNLLAQFTTGEQSLARMLKNSAKYSKIFVQAQLREADNFRKAIKNFSFAMQRFDSLSEPLHRIFLLLPQVLVFLGELSRVGDRTDAQWARSLLRSLTGPESYSKVYMKAGEVSDFLHTMEVLFDDLAILDETAAEDTITGKVASAIKKMPVIKYWEQGKERACSIPPASHDRLHPVCRDIYKLVKAFVNTQFPDHELVNAYAALRLDKAVPWNQRRKLLRTIAAHEQCSDSDLWTPGLKK
ncbi:unnamed protein product, partial [Symbiodinium sp. CCMP2456]